MEGIWSSGVSKVLIPTTIRKAALVDSGVVVALVAVAMVVGIVGTIVPFVPGLGLIAAAAVVYGVVEGFGVTGWICIAVIVGFGVAGTAAGYVLPKRAAGAAGAPTSSLLVGAAGAIAGFFLIPIIGLPVGGAIGIYLGERARTGSHEPAWRATVATLKGYGAGALAQFAAGLAMAVAWVVWVVISG